MTANAIAIARDLVNKGGADEQLANAIAEAVVTHFDEASASKAVARVEAKVDAERETKSDRLDRMEARMDRMENKVDKIESDVTGLKASDKWNKGLLIAILLLLVRDVIINS